MWKGVSPGPRLDSARLISALFSSVRPATKSSAIEHKVHRDGGATILNLVSPDNPPTPGHSMPGYAIYRNLCCLSLLGSLLTDQVLSLQISSQQISLRKCPPENLLQAAELSVNAFYEDQRTIFTAPHFKTLTNMQFQEMSHRSMLRNQYHTFCELFTLMDSRNRTIGVCELFLQELDQQLLVEMEPSLDGMLLPNNLGKVAIPKIANLAIEETYRGQGLGTKLIEACIRQSISWGFDCVCLYVDDDNYSARELYRRLGFRDLYLDKTEKKYVMQSLWLKLVPASKYLMIKFIG